MRLRAGAATLLVGAAVTACGGHSESWQYGYDNAGAARQMVGAGVDEESACRSIAGVGQTPDGHDSAEVIQGCLAALADASG